MLLQYVGTTLQAWKKEMRERESWCRPWHILYKNFWIISQIYFCQCGHAGNEDRRGKCKKKKKKKKKKLFLAQTTKVSDDSRYGESVPRRHFIYLFFFSFVDVFLELFILEVKNCNLFIYLSPYLRLKIDLRLAYVKANYQVSLAYLKYSCCIPCLPVWNNRFVRSHRWV